MIYLVMCLNDIIGGVYYTDKALAEREVNLLNEKYGGDFWIKELVKFG